jgi:hypothetical protein
MHAILVTFRPEASEQQFMEQVGPRMKEKLPTTRGLIMKTFVESAPDRWGAFYLFTDQEAASDYLDGEFFQWFSGTSLLSDLQVAHFAVDEEPSIAFGTPSLPLVETRAA